MEASPFVADPRILIIFVLFLLSSCCIAQYRKVPGRWCPGQISTQQVVSERGGTKTQIAAVVSKTEDGEDKINQDGDQQV